MRKDHLEHLIWAVCIQLATWGVCALFGIPLGDFIGAYGAIMLFYGRERRDFEIYATNQRKCNLAALTLKDYLPWAWDRDGQWDFWCPVAGVIAVLLWRIIPIIFS